jgi:hypothetical protein
MQRKQKPARRKATAARRHRAAPEKLAADLPQLTLAELFGVTVKSIQRWEEEGLPRNADGTYPLAKCISWWGDRRARLALEEHGGESELDRMRTRKLEAEARRAELELAREEGTLIPIDVHEERLEARCQQLAARCKGLGRYLGDVLSATADVDAMALLERIGDDLLRALMEVASEIEEPEALEVEEEGESAA